MHCLKCDYPLFNLAPGSCPECGTSFKPTDYEFPVGRLRFCCPDCDQAYYGDGPTGHLQPAEFECVSCRRRLTEDECVIRPLVGEAEIASQIAPLFQPNTTLVKRFFRTCGWAMVRPVELGNGTPVSSSTMTAVAFMAVIQFLGLAVGAFPLLAMVVAIPMIAGAGMPVGGIVFPVLLAASGGMLFTMVLIPLNACVVHLVLVLTGGVAQGLGRTVTLCCLGSGPAILVAIPCFGPYCGIYLSGIWMIVSTTLLLIHGQRVNGWRASISVLVLPIVLIVLLFVFVFLGTMSATAATRRGPNLVNVGMASPSGGDHTREVSAALRTFSRVADPESPEVFLFAIDTLVPDLLPNDESNLIQIEGNGFSGWQGERFFLLTVPGSGAILATPTQRDGDVARFLVVEVSGMIESTSKVAEADLRGDLVKRLEALGGRGRDLSKSQVQGWIESVEREPVSSP